MAFCIFSGDHQPGIKTPLPPGDRLERVSSHKPQLTTIPHYMMPALFLPFRSFPTLPSGKANRKALVGLVERMDKNEISQYMPLSEQAKCLKLATAKKSVAEVKYEIPQSFLLAIESAGITYHQNIEDIYPCSPGQIEFLTQGHKRQQFWNLTTCRDLPQNFDFQQWKDVTT